jgi:HJR/Mrr/RecB family endonuclease
MGNQELKMRKIDMGDILLTSTQLILGANYSIEVAANVAFGFAHIMTPLTTEDIFELADERLRLRSVIGLSFALPYDAGRYQGIENLDFVKSLKNHEYRGWSIRTIQPFNGSHFLLVDDKVALVSSPGNSFDDGAVHLVEDAQEVKKLKHLFETYWQKGRAIDSLYDYVNASNIDLSPELFQISEDKWDSLIKRLMQNPDQLHSLSSREFEEFIAELLTRDGFRVKLTPPTRDGGKDILAFADTAIGEHLYYVECKRYAPRNPVDVTIVRQLYGVLDAENATAGMIVTTSSFTKDARSFQNLIKHRLTLKDYDELKRWLKLTRT